MSRHCAYLFLSVFALTVAARGEQAQGAPGISGSVGWITSEGLMMGQPDGAFHGEQPITGYELARVMARIADRVGRASIKPSQIVPAPADDPRYLTASQWDVVFDSWAYDSVQFAYDLGVFEGAFSGPQPSPRGEVACAIASLARLTGDIPGATRPEFERACVRLLQDRRVTFGPGQSTDDADAFVRAPTARAEFAHLLQSAVTQRAIPWYGSHGAARLSVMGEMIGAEVYVEGEPRGTVPCEISIDLGPLTHREVSVSARLPGDETVSGRVTLIQGQTAAWAPALESAVAASIDESLATVRGQSIDLAARFVEIKALAEIGAVEAAIDEAKELVAGTPTWTEGHGLLGWLYQLNRDESSAKQYYAMHQFMVFVAEQRSGSSKPAASELADAEALMIFLTNEERLSRGLEALTPSANLTVVSRGHSREMMALNYFSHTSPTPGRGNCRDRFYQLFGFQPPVLAENLARRWGASYCFDLGRIAESHQRLMNSPKHKYAILWEKVDEIGMGVAVNAGGDYWITEMFARM